MNKSGGFAPVSINIIKDLNEVFPLRDDFSPSYTEKELMYYLGQRSLIRFLEHQHKLQNENILTKD